MIQICQLRKARFSVFYKLSHPSTQTFTAVLLIFIFGVIFLKFSLLCNRSSDLEDFSNNANGYSTYRWSPRASMTLWSSFAFVTLQKKWEIVNESRCRNIHWKHRQSLCSTNVHSRCRGGDKEFLHKKALSGSVARLNDTMIPWKYMTNIHSTKFRTSSCQYVRIFL